MKNIAIVVGHSEDAQGAKAFTGISEYKFNTLVANQIKMLSLYRTMYNIETARNINIGVYNRDSGISRMVAEIACSKLMDGLIELHFNSFKKMAHGVECLSIATDLESIRFGEHVSETIASVYRERLRHTNGVKPLSLGDRGFYNLALYNDIGIKQKIIVEPTFANFETNVSKQIIENPFTYGELLYDIIEHFFS